MKLKLDTTYIRYQIALQNKTQAEIAEMAGITPMTMSNMLIKGTARPLTVHKVAKALGLSVADVYRNPREQ